MKTWLKSLAPVIVTVMVVVVGISQQRMLVAMPSMLCALPLTLWWSGYVVGRSGGAFRSPIAFGERPRNVVHLPHKQDIPVDEQRVLQRYREKKAAQSGAKHKVGKDLG